LLSLIEKAAGGIACQGSGGEGRFMKSPGGRLKV
jgi:hypothetical protein